MSNKILEQLTQLRDEAAAQRDHFTDVIKKLSLQGSFRELPDFVAACRDAETSVRNFNTAMNVAKIQGD